MNPCAKNKRRIAWMASGVLEANDVEALRHHLESCPGCRRYWLSMSELSQRLVNASELPHAEPTESFHRRVVQQIKEQEQRVSLFFWITTVQQLWAHRRLAAISAVVVLGITILLWIQILSREERRVPSGVQLAVVPVGAGHVASAPTLASYRRAADVSLESLDALLTQQAFQSSSVGERFTVSSLLVRSLEN